LIICTVNVFSVKPVPLPIKRDPLGAAEALIPVPPRKTLSCCSVDSTPEASLMTTPAVFKAFADKVVNAPVPGVVAPIAVLLIPVDVVLKLLLVIVRSLEPVEILDAERPDRVRAPEVPVRLTAPVVTVNPSEAVRRPAEVDGT